MSDAIFHDGLLKDYYLVDRPGTFIVPVRATVKEPYMEDEYPRYLIPLRVISSEGLVKILEILNEFPRIPYNMASQYMQTGAIFMNEGIEEIDLPVKGERVIATFDYDNNNILRCKNIELLPREELETVKIENLTKFRKILNDLIH